MSVICVTYDLRKPGQAWPEMDERLKALGASRVLYSCWLLSGTGTTPGQVWQWIAPVVDSNDRVLVMSLGREANWFGLPEAWTGWLKANL